MRRPPASGQVSGARAPHGKLSATASALMSSAACPVISARFSHAVGASPGGDAAGLEGARAGADAHAAMSHTTDRIPNPRVTAC